MDLYQLFRHNYYVCYTHKLVYHALFNNLFPGKNHFQIYLINQIFLKEQFEQIATIRILADFSLFMIKKYVTQGLANIIDRQSPQQADKSKIQSYLINFYEQNGDNPIIYEQILLNQKMFEASKFIRLYHLILLMHMSLNPQRLLNGHTQQFPHQLKHKQAFFQSSKNFKQYGSRKNLKSTIDNVESLRLSSPALSQKKLVINQQLDKKAVKQLPGRHLMLSPQYIKNIQCINSPRLSQNVRVIRNLYKKFEAGKESIQLSKLSLPITLLNGHKEEVSSKFIEQKFKKNDINSIRARSPAFLSKKDDQQSIRKQGQLCQIENLKRPSFLKKASYSPEKASKQAPIHSYKIVKHLGVGHFGDYFMAIHKSTGCLVTLKKIKKAKVKSNNLIDRIIRTIKRQHFSNHPNIRKLYGIFCQQNYVYLVMEYMQVQMTAFMRQKLKFCQKQATQKLYQIGTAVHYIHSNGFIHRNIQAESVFLVHNVCKLCNFELATPISQKQQLQQAFLFDGQSSISRTQFKAISPAFDMWCLGILGYQLLTGKAIFNSIRNNKSSRKLYPIKASHLQYPVALSIGAKDILSRLLEPISKNRIKIDEFLACQFIKNHKEKNQWSQQEKKAQMLGKQKQEKSKRFLKKKFSIQEF